MFEGWSHPETGVTGEQPGTLKRGEIAELQRQVDAAIRRRGLQAGRGSGPVRMTAAHIRNLAARERRAAAFAAEDEEDVE